MHYPGVRKRQERGATSHPLSVGSRKKSILSKDWEVRRVNPRAEYIMEQRWAPLN